MKNYVILLVLLGLFAVVTCQDNTDKQSDEASLREWMKEYVANNNEGNFKNYGSFWTEDAIWMPPGSPIIHGKQKILDYAEPFFTQYTIDQKATIEEIKVVNGIGYIRTAVKEKYTPVSDEGKPIELAVKGIFILKKRSNGSWIATHCIWNNDSSTS